MVGPTISQFCLHWPFLFLQSSRPIKACIRLYPYACPHPVSIINSLHQTHTTQTPRDPSSFNASSITQSFSSNPLFFP
ncbi:unnamed protein product [Hymenolepis diminuta]|uniref:Uncharacterized protein n=1 Tax=Hymenolepis diminuta TaxID=6216 RepID=A0A564Z1K7_HYMDI|nr:unnamed protein product [Hymenolepis diminuta]